MLAILFALCGHAHGSSAANPFHARSFDSITQLCDRTLTNPAQARITTTEHRTVDGDLITITEREAEGNLLVRTIERRPAPYLNSALPVVDDEWHLERILPIVDFGSAKFERRRWQDSFRGAEKMRATARRHLKYSTYFEVLRLISNERLGSLRIIRLPHGSDLKIPEAEYLGLDLDWERVRSSRTGTEVAFQTEIGTFAIEKNAGAALRAGVWYELWLELTEAMLGRQPQVDYYGNVMHAYGDEESLKLYLPLGFDHLRSYVRGDQRIEFEPGERPPPIVKDGTNWWPLVWFPHGLDVLNERAFHNHLRHANGVERREAKSSQAAFDLQSTDRLLELFAGTDDDRARLAEVALVHRLERMTLHYREAMNEANRIDRLKRARDAYAALGQFTETLERRFREIQQTGRPVARLQLVEMLSWILKDETPRPHLSDPTIAKEFLMAALADADYFVVEGAGFALRSLSPERWMALSDVTPETRGARATAERARLSAAGLSDAEIESAAAALARMWAEPVFRAPRHDLDVSYQDNRFISAAVWTIYKLSVRNIDVMNALVNYALSRD